MSVLRLLCAGAAHGVVAALEPRWAQETGLRLDARYGPVGGLKEALLGGAPCDVFVATAAIVDALVAAGRLDRATRAKLGRVATGIAILDSAPVPRIDDADALRGALLAADRLFVPDPQRATAGIHFTSVLQRLGIHDRVASRLSIHPGGAAAMRALAASGDAAALGCTQVSEILDTAGVRLAAPLPPGYDLVTTYAAAACAGASDPAAARDFVALITGGGSAALRAACGIEPPGD